MPFIRVQNLKKDEQGRIVRGSAGLIDAVYVKGQIGRASCRERV